MGFRHPRILFGLIVALCAGQVLAARAPAKSQWLAIANSQSGQLELDKSRVGHGQNGQLLAWSRLSLGYEIPDSGGTGRYNAIEALNSYDCSNKRFTTLKRVYLRKGNTLREEIVASPRSIEAGNDTVDARLLSEACKPRTFSQAQQIAETAGKALAGSEKMGPMLADMRTEATANKPHVMPVSAEAKDSKEKPAASSTPTTAPTASKRYIELPKVDKSKLEDPNLGPAKLDAKTEASKESTAKSAEKSKYGIAPADRLAIEQQLATHGPKKVVKRKKKKPAAAPKEEAHEAAASHAHWSYEGEGAPANWSKLSPANITCTTGKRQSPIDIREGIRVELEPIVFDYKSAQFTVIDNGHTVQVNVGEGNTITVMGRTFQLLQFHFHRPSEERVNGRTYDMVAHLVHKDMEGNLAVIAVLFEKGLEHPQIQTLWNNMPLEVNQTVSPNAVLDLAKLLPEKRNYWTYMGSLTTPPCTENVLWMVMKQPIAVSPDQIAIFSRLYKNNARPIQPSNGRLIKESR